MAFKQVAGVSGNDHFDGGTDKSHKNQEEAGKGPKNGSIAFGAEALGLDIRVFLLPAFCQNCPHKANFRVSAEKYLFSVPLTNILRLIHPEFVPI